MSMSEASEPDAKPMRSRILVGVDGSEHTARTLAVATEPAVGGACEAHTDVNRPASVPVGVGRADQPRRTASRFGPLPPSHASQGARNGAGAGADQSPGTRRPSRLLPARRRQTGPDENSGSRASPVVVSIVAKGPCTSHPSVRDLVPGIAVEFRQRRERRCTRLHTVAHSITPAEPIRRNDHAARWSGGSAHFPTFPSTHEIAPGQERIESRAPQQAT